MEQPQIRYTKTSDGVSIAYWTCGDGPPLVYIPQPLITASAADYEFDATRSWYRRLSAGRTLIRFDHRGTGQSQQNGTFSLTAFLLDLSAVVDELGIASFDLWGDQDGGVIAAAYAAVNPARVNHLILWNSWSRAIDIPESETLQTLDRLIDSNWGLFARTAVTLDSAWAPDEGRKYAQYVADACEPGTARAFIRATWDFDIDGGLADITCPTLVLHRRSQHFFPVALGRRLAAGIPGSRLALVEGASFYPWFEYADLILDLVSDFAPGAPTAESTRTMRAPKLDEVRTVSLRTVIFTDIVGHTEMMQRLGDTKGRDLLREHERMTREMLKQHGGAEIKTMGDGFMASFGSVTKAMECAIALQRAFAAHTESMPEPLHVRVGLNAGEPIEEDGDLFGSTVILASRIAAKAGPGEILVPDTVRGLLSGKGFMFGDRGEFVPKGFEDAVRLYEVRWRESG